MAQVKRFTLPGAFSAGTDVFVPGAGLFTRGTLDIAVGDTSALASVRAAAPAAIETGPLDNTVTPLAVPRGDPYPEYLKYSELVDSVTGGTDELALSLKAAFVPRWQPSTAYAASDLVLSPTGQIVQANAAFTSGASYSASNWTVVAGASGGGAQLTPTATKTGAYTAAVGELAVMNVAGGATALTLPAAPADKAQVGFLAVGASAAVPLTVTRGGSATIGPAGATSVTAPFANEVTVYQYDAANSRWLAVANVKPAAALDVRYAQRLAPQRSLPGYYVGAFGGLATDVGVMDATFTSGSTVIQNHQIVLDCTDLRVVLPHGWKVSTASTIIAETASPSSEPVKVSIQVGTATYPVTFNGSRTPTIDPGGRVVSDPIGGLWLAGTQLKVRILNGQISGASYPLTLPATGPGINPAFTDNRWSKNTDVVDATTAGTAANASDNLWGACLIGRPTSATPFSLGAVGDSITHGTGDSNATGGALSWFTRATNSVVPAFRFARNGQWASAVAAVSFYSMPMMSGCSHAMVLLGTNDLLNNTRTYAQIIGDLTTIYRALLTGGVKPIGVTIPPRTASTDAWATTANQTIDKVPYQGGVSSIRSQVNAWIRAGGGGYLAGYFELADAVESARNSGLWAPNMTGDGTHPNVAGHTAIAAAVNLTAIAAL